MHDNVVKVCNMMSYKQLVGILLDLTDLMPWRRRCSPRALAAQVAYDALPLMSILCGSGGFSERQLQSVAVLLDVVYPLLPSSSWRSTFGDVFMKRVCGYLSTTLWS